MTRRAPRYLSGRADRPRPRIEDTPGLPVPLLLASAAVVIATAGTALILWSL
ncbi:MAG: hypothetical protein KDJ82_16260 [Rhodobacteraceae bacterium]|nr:hypothetical protein [Paracoccaceae bacterium]